MSKKDSIIINRTCPQCFHGFGSKAEFLSHMTEDYKHRYSKAAALRAWKKADVDAKTEELTAQIEALGLVQCDGCHAAFNPADAACSDSDRYSPKHVCKVCYREIADIGVIVCSDGYWHYWYPNNNSHWQTPMKGCSGWYDSAADAEKHLRSHMAQNRLCSDNSNWQECLAIIQDTNNRREYLSHVAWHMAYRRLGYRPESVKDPNYQTFSQTEASIYQEIRQAA